MDFRRTFRAIMAVVILAAVALALTAITGKAEMGIKAREDAIRETTAAGATTAPTVQVIITEPPTMQPVEIDGDLFTYYPAVGLDFDLQRYIFCQCGEAVVDYELVLAIITWEHRGHPSATAISPTDDYGLMQINKINFEEMARYGLTDMLDPEQNVVAGITILCQLQERFDYDMAAVLMGYNMGPGAARNAINSGITSTNYTGNVLQIRQDIINGSYTPDNFVGGKYQRGD